MRKALVAAVAVAAAVGFAPAVNADQSDYLDSLESHGMYVTDTAAALTIGWAVCTALRSEVPLWDIGKSLIYEGGLTPKGAADVVMSAVTGLCPDTTGYVLAEAEQLQYS